MALKEVKMTKICIVYTVVVMFLAGCGGKGNSSSGGAPGKPAPPPADFSPFFMQTKSECAGFRRSFNELNGNLALAPDNAAIWVRLQLDQNGKYRLIYQEQPAGAATPRTLSVTDGGWQASGSTIELQGEANGRLYVVNGVLQLTGLKAPRATLGSPGQPIPLSVQKTENDKVIVQCSSKDNPELTESGGEVLIAGKPAMEFWTKRLWLDETADWKKNHPNVGETVDNRGVLSRVEVRVYKDGTYTIRKLTGVQGPQGEAGGTWKVTDGLLVLGETGVIVPHRGGRALEPLLYINVDPVTKKPAEGAMQAFNISARGL